MYTGDEEPLGNPTVELTESPTQLPAISPTTLPTMSPTKLPTISPTTLPTVSPPNIIISSTLPTEYPTSRSPSTSKQSSQHVL